MQDLYSDMKDKVSPPMRKNCSVASEITGNDALPSDFVEQKKKSSIMESRRKDSSEWTNEKHSLYLKSIEASFVDQLYNSLDMQSCQTQKTYTSDAISARKNHANSHIPSGQFKVLQRGSWSKKHFRRENSQLKDADRPNVSTGNPWIQHFTNGNRHGAVAFPSFQESPSSSATLLQYPVPVSQLHQESDCSNTEVTDQNFVEDTLIEKANRPPSRKRMKKSKLGHSSNDQVVPFCTSATEIAGGFVNPKK